jgi:lipopolysaccharide export system protein LptA
MRGTRWLLLAAISAILVGIGITYRDQTKVLSQEAPPKPTPLPVELNWASDRWHWTQTEKKSDSPGGNRAAVEISGRNPKQVKDSSQVDLEDVEMKIYHKDGGSYDDITCAAASFFPSDHRMYSEGDVRITLGQPLEGQPKHTLVSIASSGVTFDSDSGKTETARAASFTFQNGDGSAVGASYDPTTHELLMNSQVELHWKTPDSDSQPMKIETASLIYREAAGEIWLQPWGRLTRENTVVEGDSPIVHLRQGLIQQVQALRAHGSDTYPNRRLQYSADELWVDFNGHNQVRKITAQTNARLVSSAETSETSISAYHVELNFDTETNESLLTGVTASGGSVVVSKPLPAPGRDLDETHILHSNAVEMKMRPGGRDIAGVEIHSPGTLEFVPNMPAQHHRLMEGSSMTIAYGADNRIESFHANDAKTTTDPTAEEKKRGRALTVTASKELLARFNQSSGRMSNMEQSGDFTYDSGERKARATKATLDSDENVIQLQTGARIWDATGFTSADHIRMDQRTGDFAAEGRVNSSRMPDSDNKKSSEMLSGDEPVQAQAGQMRSTNHNRAIHYAGNVVMWQGANRVRGDVVDLDREKRTLVADGNAVTELWEGVDDKGDKPKKGAEPVLTVVHAPHLVYTEENRLAVYTGGVLLTRPSLRVKGTELRAYLAESGADSRLEKAFADGAVEIVQTATDRTRTGIAEHSEYYTDNQKVVLRGGEPRMLDSLKGNTHGAELTYFANDDRLLVNGVADKPATSQIRRK